MKEPEREKCGIFQSTSVLVVSRRVGVGATRDAANTTTVDILYERNNSMRERTEC